jgi:hypothetical protein
VYLNYLGDFKSGDVVEVTGIVQRDGASIMETKGSHPTVYTGEKEFGKYLVYITVIETSLLTQID